MDVSRDNQPLPPDVNLGPGLLASIWIEMAVCTLVLLARYYTRTQIVKKVAPDDWVMLVASVMGITSNILYTVSVNYGTGRHEVYLTAYQSAQAFKFNITSQVVGIFSITLARLSYAMLLLAVLSKQQLILRFVIWTLVYVQLVVNLTYSIFILAQCQPISKLWDPSVPGTCLALSIQTDLGFVQGALNSATDLALAVLPSVVIWNLNMKFAVKLSLCVSMGLGIFAMAASIGKTVYIMTLADLDDYSYKTSYLLICLSLEHHLIMIAANIPTLRPLLAQTRKSYARSSGSKIGSLPMSPDMPYCNDRHDRVSRGYSQDLEQKEGTTKLELIA